MLKPLDHKPDSPLVFRQAILDTVREMSSQVILVTAPGGHIGTQLIPQLLKDDVKLVLPTSNAERLRSSLPSTTTQHDVAMEEGKIDDPTWVQAILERYGVDTVLLNLTGTDELLVTLNFLDAMRKVGSIKHLVYVSAAGDFVSEKGLNHIVATHGAMHVLIKPLIERKLSISNYRWTTTVLGPTLFFDNDLRCQKFIMQGIFDEPRGQKGVSRVSTVDIATIARNTLLAGSKWAGKKIMIGSKRLYTGEEIEALWSEAVGREVKMCSSNDEGLDKFEQIFTEKSGSRAWTRDMRLMYETFSADGFGMTDEEYEVQISCLGREPMDYESWVRETGKAWTSEQQ